MKQMAIQLVWYKRDLRVEDHAPLAQAAKAGECVGLYVYEPELIEAEDFDAAHLNFINDSLKELRENLRNRGSELLLRTGTMPDVLMKLHREIGIAKIWAHEETFNFISYQRDRRVRAWAKAESIPFTEIPQYGVVRRLKDRDGWANQCALRMKQPIVAAPAKIGLSDEVRSIPCGEIQTVNQFQVRAFERVDVQAGGESNANRYLDSFLQKRGVNYRSDMSSPLTGEAGCSRLSPFIAMGNISMRTIHQRTTARADELKQQRKSGIAIEPTWLKSLSSFKSRLSWHCHFMQKLEDEPEIEFQNFNRAYDGLREDDFNEEYFAAWCEGRTGYPMVDACMRALNQTGWINFRMRAMLVSFSSYHLWLHWRRPAVYLARLFLDYEPGIHYSQIQMQAGVTGINTVRIYSPIKQVIDQDPQGVFIRRYLPELTHVPDKHLAEPHKMTSMEQTLFECRIGRDYPAPIVDHKARYKDARDKMHSLKKLPFTREASAKVFQKHGSRKSPSNRR
jgi:deoxyribodipyrimidine photo-lyase